MLLTVSGKKAKACIDEARGRVGEMIGADSKGTYIGPAHEILIFANVQGLIQGFWIGGSNLQRGFDKFVNFT